MPTTDFLAETLVLAEEKMLGQIRDLCLDHIKAGQALPWNLRPESEQKAIIEFVELSLRQALSQAVEIIARDGKQAIVAQVEQVVVKDGLKVVLKTQATEAHLMMLGRAVGATVLVTAADADPYLGAQQRDPEALQGGLFDDGDDGAVFDNTPHGNEPKG